MHGSQRLHSKDAIAPLSPAVAAAELMEPKAQFVKLPSRTIKTDEDIEAWLLDAKQTIALALKSGPVILH